MITHDKIFSEVSEVFVTDKAAKTFSFAAFFEKTVILRF